MANEFQRFMPLVLDEPRLATGFFSRSAVTMFVDISGFTTLSEKLAAVGTAGTEQLGEMLREALGGAMDIVSDEGGDTLAFGGDAITVAFAAGTESPTDRAQRCGRRIIELVTSLQGRPTLIGPLQLAVKVGIASGSVTTMVCRSDTRSTIVHLGSGLHAAAAAEEDAAPGTIVCRVVDSEAGVIGRSGGRSEIGRRFVHPVVASRIELGRRVPDEHRRTTAAFLSLPVVSDGDTEGLARLSVVVTTAMRLLDELGGELVDCIGGDKGLVLYACFGAHIARSDDAARAVGFVEQLRSETGVAFSGGLCTGLVWVGIVGGSSRAFVGTLGDTVNSAARLMGAAEPNTTLIDERTRRAAGPALSVRNSRLLSVKGKTKPIEVHEVASVTGRIGGFVVGESPLVGRESELDALIPRLGGCLTGEGVFVEIEGVAGSGKSRLAAETARRLELQGIRVEREQFDGYGMGHPLGPFRSVLARRLGLDGEYGLDELQNAVRQLLPGGERLVPLLAPLLGIDGGENEFTEPIPIAERSELMTSAVVSITRAVDSPTLLVLEDVHWADEASAAVLANLAELEGSSLLSVLATGRPTDPPRARFPGSVVVLRELDAEALATLVADTWSMLGGARLDSDVVREIVDRSAGSPLFAALTTELVRRNWSPGEPIPEVPLFEELFGIMIEQLDQLPDELGELALRVAVVGRVVPPGELASMFGLPTDVVDAGMKRLAALGFLAQRPSGFESRHASLAETFRERSSHADREPLHRSVASWLTAHGGSAREIAGHLQHCSPDLASLRWFREARDDAHHLWSIREARRWADLADASPGNTSTDWLITAEIAMVLGHYVEAEHMLATAADGNDDDRKRSEVEFLKGKLLIETGRPAGGVDHLLEAERLGCARAELSWPLTIALCDLGRFGEAEERSRRDAASADVRERLDALANLGVVLARRGEFASAKEALSEAASLAEASGDLMRLIHANGDLAGVSFETGELAESIVLLDRAAALAQRIGAHRASTMALGNQAQVRLASGDLAGARRVAAAAMRAAFRLPDPGLASAFAETLIVVAEAEGRHDQSRRWWARHAAVERRLGRGHEAAISTLREATLLARGGRIGEAASRVNEARDLLEHADDTPDSREHLERAESAIGGDYRPPPELSPAPLSATAAMAIDASMPEVSPEKVEDLLQRLEVMSAGPTNDSGREH